MTEKYSNVIIIPYRNREKHLDYFIKNTVPLIEEFMPNTLVVVVEQEEGKMFNRGAILNIIFSVYETNAECFITHDVDINPTKKCIQEFYNKKISSNEILGILVSPCDSLAPIVKITSSDVKKINGFPNNFWGWGAEDIALKVRAEHYNLDIKKIFINKDKSRDDEYFKCFNDVNDRQDQNNSKNHYLCKKYFSSLTNPDKEKYIKSSGINNLQYKIIERKKMHNIVELIKVSI
jgi:hypothetical protein